jgi:hypothetical protein
MSKPSILIGVPQAGYCPHRTDTTCGSGEAGNTKDILSAFWTGKSARHRGVKLCGFFVWICLVSLMAWHHDFWRDEVRAFSIAISGRNVVEMFKSLHGEGHPAVWYLLLRSSYFVFRSPTVLPLVSICIAALAALLLVLRSPFSWWMIALLLLNNLLLFEYSVMARNYGISVLLLFLLANFYWRYRTNSVWLGILLFLLANTNAHSVLLVGAFLLYWLIDILGEYGSGWTQAFKTFLINAAISMAGVAVCFVTIFPTFNDAALISLPDEVSLRPLADMIVLPAGSFQDMWPSWAKLGLLLSDSKSGTLETLMKSILMFGSLLGLIRSPGAFISGLAALISFSLFFRIITPGEYRHEALWLFFLVSLYWIVNSRNAVKELYMSSSLKSLRNLASGAGSFLMTLLVALQALNVGGGGNGGVKGAIAGLAFGGPPLSRARDFSAFVSERSDLQDAIIIADPDYLLEALPYYIPNATYLIREGRFGHWVKFAKNARLSIDLDDILAAAKTLRMESGKPILILLRQKLDLSKSQIYHEGYNWTLLTTPDQVSDFLTTTRHLVRFGPAISDETFDVYLLDR